MTFLYSDSSMAAWIVIINFSSIQNIVYRFSRFFWIAYTIPTVIHNTIISNVYFNCKIALQSGCVVWSSNLHESSEFLSNGKQRLIYDRFQLWINMIFQNLTIFTLKYYMFLPPHSPVYFLFELYVWSVLVKWIKMFGKTAQNDRFKAFSTRWLFIT